ncbi:M20 family metallo-hydrolase [Fervidicoccus fontis]|uniref:Diaminopimelate aminotransferase n=1 Tax=Fervidicoccus fontis TaxID=683846 RepID=A0A2J6N479_9CREN|nr:M20 family metallo-hydrolase [Fervidicoccus fontis]PMB76139.1 MAG: diaminopimelate aminotransferase [Fervidicoccus fontis]PMB77701.1 MAG: diaminopimelate aminotransferase [Fervidicoccus fontis]HEW63557.1 M20 family metallo-hydrolase [Fervidicoccus fontis]
MPKELLDKVESLKDEMVNTLVELIKIPAISPSSGGEGELDKAKKLLEIIKKWKFDDIIEVNAPDPRAKGGIRPNIVAIYKGKNEKDKIWFLTHMDVVPPGELSKWTECKPFEPVVKNGKVYGRGSVDNGQSLVASLYAVKALMDLGIRPSRTVALAFVSDEETGSEYGAQYLLKARPDLFGENDWIVVPDGGNSEGSFIEIAEKGILWLRVKVTGKQVHGSMPDKGLNAHRVAADFVITLDKKLHEKFNKRNDLFDPPRSTFEPTMVRGSAGSVNIIPSDHEITFDCRILPEYTIDEVLNVVNQTKNEIIAKHKKVIEGESLPKIEIEIVNRSDSTKPTDPNSEIVKKLTESIQKLRGITPKTGGIGGGTVAAFFRQKGIPAVVWCTIDEVEHQPNEYASIKNMVEDAKVFLSLMI